MIVLPAVTNTKRIQVELVIDRIQLMNLQFLCDIVHTVLKMSRILHPHIHAVIEILRRQNFLRRPFTDQSQKSACHIPQIITLRNTGKYKICLIVICLYGNAVPQRL